ncbi:MAG: HRDC domain-containing protein [Hyphomicrobium sp.]
MKNRKALAVLMELAAWRDRLAQAQDVPRSRVLRDEALLRHSQTRRRRRPSSSVTAQP